MAESKQWSQAKQFLEQCTHEHTHIFHDSDADGIGAGLLLLNAITDMGGIVTSTTRASRQDILCREELELVRDSYNPLRIIIADINPESFSAYNDIREVFPHAHVLIIDHHQVTEFSDAIYLHPKELFSIDGSRYCTSKLALDLISDVTDSSDYTWMAAFGIIGDMNTEYFGDVIVQALEQEGFSSPDIAEDSALYVINEAILCCSAKSDESLIDYYHMLSTCSSLREATLLENPASEVRDFVEEQVRVHEPEVAASNTISWVSVDTDYAVTSWLGNKLTLRHPMKVIVVSRNDGEGVKVSIRCRAPAIDCGAIARECAQSCGGYGGGHVPAAGAWVDESNFEKFRECVQLAVESALSKAN